jgi:hypothetical protein
MQRIIRIGSRMKMRKRREDRWITKFKRKARLTKS